jgi:predicted Zn-dependent protease
MQKHGASVNAQTIEPGKYTVILEPTAAGDLWDY